MRQLALTQRLWLRYAGEEWGQRLDSKHKDTSEAFFTLSSGGLVSREKRLLKEPSDRLLEGKKGVRIMERTS
jgi:hypothetical protein